MTTIELTHYPELSALAAELRQGRAVAVTDHGQPMGEIVPMRGSNEALVASLRTLQASFTSPMYPGNSVTDMRQESR